MEPGEDAGAAEEGEFAVGQLGAEEVIDRALRLGGEGGMTGAFARVVAGAMPAGAPGSPVSRGGRPPARRRR